MLMRSAALTLASIAFASGTAHADLVAGAGRAVIDIPAEILPLQGFGSLHDSLNARVILLGDGGTRAAIVIVDLTSINDQGVTAMKGIVAAATGAAPEAVLIVASHTFSAPHMVTLGEHAGAGQSDAEQKRGAWFNANVLDAVKRAAIASARTQPARIGVGTGASHVNVNRNVLTAAGWWLGANENGPSDKSVHVVKIADTSGKPIAMVLNYAVQSAVMDQAKGKDGNKGITADLGGAAVSHIETQYGGGLVAAFLPGAAGDQFPAYKSVRYVLDKGGHTRLVDIGDAGYPLVTMQGERLGSEAVRIAEKTVASVATASLNVVHKSIELPQQERPRDLQQIHATKSYTYITSGKRAAPYKILQIGELAIVGVQVELSAATGAYIRQHSPFRNTLVVTMVDGAAKYLPEAIDYKNFTYEAQNSSYAPGSAETLTASILASLRAAHAGKTN